MDEECQEERVLEAKEPQKDEYAELIRILKEDAEDFNMDSR